MCNEYHQRLKLGDYTRERFNVPVHWATAEGNRHPDQPLKPTNRAPILRPIDPANPAAGLEGAETRWWLVPFFHRKAVKDWRAMCTNARIETVDTTGTFRDAYKKRRALVPVTSFIEYDSPPGWKRGDPKRRWEITWADGEPRYFAGLWERSNPSDYPDGLESFAFITGPASPDIEPIHDRTPVILTAEEGLQWLDLSGAGKDAWSLAPKGTYTLTETPRRQFADA